MTEQQTKHYPDLMPMKMAMDYLVEHGVACRSRKSFYKLLENFRIPYVDLNPGGKKASRRFRKDDLDTFIKDETAFLRQREEASRKDETDEA